MEPAQGVLRAYKTAVEEGKRMRAAHVRSLFSRKSAGRKSRTGKIRRWPFRAPGQTSEAGA